MLVFSPTSLAMDTQQGYKEHQPTKHSHNADVGVFTNIAREEQATKIQRTAAYKTPTPRRCWCFHQRHSRWKGNTDQTTTIISLSCLPMASGKRYELTFFTATILDWKFLLVTDNYKDIIIDSLKYLVNNKKIILYAFTIMDNHMHILWHILHPFRKEDVQRDFLKYTAQMIIMDLKQNDEQFLQEFYVGAKDRLHQIWERNPLSIDIWSNEVLMQKLAYIHANPVKAELCIQPEEYKYSSAAFYIDGVDRFGFLTSCFM